VFGSFVPVIELLKRSATNINMKIFATTDGEKLYLEVQYNMNLSATEHVS
jgi:hypothetical protein